jgi:hypothetical protein
MQGEKTGTIMPKILGATVKTESSPGYPGFVHPWTRGPLFPDMFSFYAQLLMLVHLMKCSLSL